MAGKNGAGASRKDGIGMTYAGRQTEDSRKYGSGRAQRKVCLGRVASYDRRGWFLRVLVGLAVALVIVLSCVGIRAWAAGSEPQLYKYYTSVRVEPGDTLWDMAGEYVADSPMTRSQFVDEVSRINGLKGGAIKSGEYIVVVYYSPEKK